VTGQGTGQETGQPVAEPQLNEARRLPEESRLQLTWSDGHVGAYQYTYLRGYCPCAGCQGHGGGPVQFKPPAADVQLQHIEAVGNYAISFLWSDGHATGIYQFGFLRELCPCRKCRPEGELGDSK
jgi:DUF971 family protein